MNPFIRMPDHWSPKKAELLLDFLDELSQAIWNKYGEALYAHWQSQATTTDTTAPHDAASGDDTAQ